MVSGRSNMAEILGYGVVCPGGAARESLPSWRLKSSDDDATIRRLFDCENTR